MHTFICLAAMSIGELLLLQMKARGIELSKNRMLEELNNIKDGWIYKGDKKVERKLEHLELEQQTLWDAVIAMHSELGAANTI